MEIKAGVIDRIEQSFDLFKNNFVGLFLPFFLYNFISVVVIGTISKYYIMTSLTGIEGTNTMDYFSFLNNPTVVIGIVIGVFLFILYLLFYVVVLLGFLKSVKQALVKEKITIYNNYIYGIVNFNNSMKTYWYVFSYIALIPSFFFIIGGILFNAGFYFEGISFIKEIGGFFMIIGALLFGVFALYRGVKSTFALYSAVNKDNYSKDNFLESINITNDNWLRIIGNFLLIGLLISIITSIIGGIIGIVSFFGSGGSNIIDQISTLVMSSVQGGNVNVSDVMGILNNYISDFSIIGEIISNTVDNILATISSVFLLIFTYLFYVRLSVESNGDIEILEQKIIIEENNKKIIEL